MNIKNQTKFTEITYPLTERPGPGKTMEIAQGVRWLAMPIPGSLAFINCYLLEDIHGWWVVDTGISNDTTRDLWHQIFANELNGKPVVGVICTHMHPDHIGQSLMITEEFQCPLYMTRAEYYQARAFSSGGSFSHSNWIGKQFYKQAGMPDDYMEQMEKMWATRASEGMTMPAMSGGYERLEANQVLSIGDNEWQIVVGSGHSPEHACLYSAELKLLISGDQILPIITSNVSVHPSEPNANPMDGWMKSHDHFLQIIPDDTFVLPAHNLPFYGVKTRLKDLISHHDDRMRAIEEVCVEPKDAKELLPVLFNRELGPPQMMMALGEAIAHVHLLLQRNRLERELDEHGVYKYRTINPGIRKQA